MKCTNDNGVLTFEFMLPIDEKISKNLQSIGESVVYMRNNRCKYETELIINATARILSEFCGRLREGKSK